MQRLDLRVPYAGTMRKHSRLLLLIAISGPAALAQAVSFGLTGGAPLLDRAV